METDKIETAVSKSELIEALAPFRRYRRACMQHPMNDWDEDTYKQWCQDRSLLKTSYEAKRHISFGEASEYAQEQLFLRCVGGG